jgi:hypothetical protein
LVPPILSWTQGKEQSQAGTEIAATLLDIVGNGIALVMIVTQRPSTGLPTSELLTLFSLGSNIIYAMFNISIAATKLGQPYPIGDPDVLGTIAALVITRGLFQTLSVDVSVANLLSAIRPVSIISPS